MSEEQQTNEQATDDGKAPQGAAASVLFEVKSAVDGAGPRVRSALVERLVDREVAERVQALDAALEKRKAAQVEVRKIDKPDVVSYNGDGTVATSTYSKAKLEERKKAADALKKVEDAIELAIAKGDFSKVRELAK